MQGWEGPCRSVGGPVPGARRVSPASPIEPARITFTGMPCQGPGDRTWSRQTSTPAHHRREATAREEPVRANRRKAAHSEGRTQAPGRRPSTRSGDACRDWFMEASGSDTRSAQHLTPLRGRPLPVWEEAMEREGAKAHVQGPELRRGPVPTGPKTRPPRSHQMAT